MVLASQYANEYILTLDGDLLIHPDDMKRILKYNDENSLACVLSLAYYAAKKTHEIYRELAGGKGNVLERFQKKMEGMNGMVLLS